MAWATQPDGRVDSLPLNIDPWMHLLQQGAVRREGHRLSEDLRRDRRRRGASSTIRRRASPASSARGLKNANVPVWSSFLLGYGGGFVDAKGKLMTETPEADRRGEDVPDAARQVRPAGRRRLQLERVAEPVRAGQGGDVARRHRLRAAARGPDQVAHRRQGRLRRDAAGPEGAGLGDVRRRRGHLVVQQEEGPVVALPAVGVEQEEPGADAAGRRRRAGAQSRRTPMPQASAALKAPQGVGRVHAGARRGSRSRACRSSCRSPSSATSSASRSPT